MSVERRSPCARDEAWCEMVLKLFPDVLILPKDSPVLDDGIILQQLL